MRVLCTGCGRDVPDGLTRPSELSWCSSECARKAGVPDEILARLRALEEAAKPSPE